MHQLAKSMDYDKLKKNFLRLVAKHEATDDFTRKIQDAIDYVHMNEEVRNAYMTIGMKINEERKEAWAQGLSQGLSQGISQGKAVECISMIIKKVEKNKTLNVIADEMEEEIEIIRPMYDAVIANLGKEADDIYHILYGDNK